MRDTRGGVWYCGRTRDTIGNTPFVINRFMGTRARKTGRKVHPSHRSPPLISPPLPSSFFTCHMHYDNLHVAQGILTNYKQFLTTTVPVVLTKAINIPTPPSPLSHMLYDVLHVVGSVGVSRNRVAESRGTDQGCDESIKTISTLDKTASAVHVLGWFRAGSTSLTEVFTHASSVQCMLACIGWKFHHRTITCKGCKQLWWGFH